MLKSPIPLSENRVKNLRHRAKRNSKKTSRTYKAELDFVAVSEGFSSWAALLKAHNSEKCFALASKGVNQHDKCYVNWGHFLGVAYRRLGVRQPRNVIQIAVSEDKEPICLCEDYIEQWKFILDTPLEYYLKKSDPYYSRMDEDCSSNKVFDDLSVSVYRLLDLDSNGYSDILQHLEKTFYGEFHNSLFEVWVNGNRIGKNEYWLVDEFEGDIYPKPLDRLPEEAFRKIGCSSNENELEG